MSLRQLRKVCVSDSGSCGFWFLFGSRTVWVVLGVFSLLIPCSFDLGRFKLQTWGSSEVQACPHTGLSLTPGLPLGRPFCMLCKEEHRHFQLSARPLAS